MKRYTIWVCFLIGLLVVGFIGSPIAFAAKKQILIAGGRTGDAWYSFAQALAKFINDKSNMLEAEVVSTAGITGNVDLVKEKPEEYIGISSFSHIHYRPGHEWGKKRGYYTGGRFIANATSMTQCIVTYDSKIKSIKDLAGKTVDVGRKGAANTPDHKAILDKYGVLDKVKFVYTGYGGGVAKMQDGLVDATMLLFNHIYPKKFSKGGLIEKAETKEPVYFIGFDRNILLELRKQQYATLPVRVPAKALDPVTQPNELWAFNDPTFFMADEKMDPEVVYEVTRIIWDTPAEEWAKWNPMGAHMNEQFKPAMPSLNLYQAHPGAKKFYQENGIELKDLAELLK
jgi:TRAP transporter TAXI family solute receptor